MSDPDWLRGYDEPVLDPELEIVDPHHHLFAKPHLKYTPDEFAADVRCGHRIQSTVIVQSGERYLTDGPNELKPVGETKYACEVAERLIPGSGICKGIVGFADLTLGDRVQQVLEEHLNVGGVRFKGIRHGVAFDGDPAMASPGHTAPAGLMMNAKFRQGFAYLEKYNLTFDAWLFHPQMEELEGLAAAFPNVKIVLDHLGCPIRIGGYAEKKREVYDKWKFQLSRLAGLPNVYVKLGGLGLRHFGFKFDEKPKPPSSEILVGEWKPFLEFAIEKFGANRCMFESNFPMDKISTGYKVLWNAFKLLTRDASNDERANLFSKTAKDFYRL